MNWFLAKIVYRIICGNGDHTAQFDEQLRLVLAANEREAFRKATDLGKKEADVFVNQKQQLVQWQFINVSELHPLTDLIDGAELYSRVNEVDDASSYITFVHHKAQTIYSEPLQPVLNLI